jgi:hypothetical protein
VQEEIVDDITATVYSAQMALKTSHVGSQLMQHTTLLHDYLEVCDKDLFIIQILSWTLSIVRDIFKIHVSESEPASIIGCKLRGRLLLSCNDPWLGPSEGADLNQ